ncbi:MAG: diacylglycerol/lipid kinase family protein [Tsuneonella sp.]
MVARARLAATEPVASGTARPRVGVIHNPRSHRNKGLDGQVADHPGVLFALPEERGDLPGVLARYAAAGIDLLVINGGDGTVRDVLTAAVPVFGERWPAIAVLPMGKTNALNVDLGAPRDWTLAGALAAFADGRRCIRKPLLVEDLAGGAPPLAGFFFGAGAFTVGVAAGQDAHQLGAFNSLAVGVTAVWGGLQALLGSDRNMWRRGVEMRLFTGPERTEFEHSGRGDPALREIFVASTLERFPFGMRFFGDRVRGLKAAVMDTPVRRLMIALPFMLGGAEGGWWKRMGLHQIRADRLEIELGDRFILDGEAFPAGRYLLREGPALAFVVP